MSFKVLRWEPNYEWIPLESSWEFLNQDMTYDQALAVAVGLAVKFRCDTKVVGSDGSEVLVISQIQTVVRLSSRSSNLHINLPNSWIDNSPNLGEVYSEPSIVLKHIPDDLKNRPTEKFYFGSITEIFGGYETSSKFLFRSTEAEVHNKLIQIQENFRGCDYKEYDDIWCDSILIKYPNYREVSEEHFNILKIYLSEL